MTEREAQIFNLIKKEPMISQEEIAARIGVKRSSVSVYISNLLKEGRLKGRGYIVDEDQYCVVIGAANMDVNAISDRKIERSQNNSGNIRLSPGGAARNIAESLARLGIKTYFCSNVCAAYRRDVFDRLGGFTSPTIFNEDMIFAAGAVKAGFKIAYAADARVVHSHNYTGRQQFSRNFDLGVSHAQYPKVFADVPPEGEGMRLVGRTAAYLLRTCPWLLPRLIWQSGAKWAGYRMGRRYDRLPLWLVKR